MFFWEVVFLVLLSRSQYIAISPSHIRFFSSSYLQARTRLFQFICINLAKPCKTASAFTESLWPGKDCLVLYRNRNLRIDVQSRRRFPLYRMHSGDPYRSAYVLPSHRVEATISRKPQRSTGLAMELTHSAVSGRSVNFDVGSRRQS
jgi:hypothetical protein